MTREELVARVEQLTAEEAAYALAWLATGGPLSHDGQAVIRALREIDDRRGRDDRARAAAAGGQL